MDANLAMIKPISRPAMKVSLSIEGAYTLRQVRGFVRRGEKRRRDRLCKFTKISALAVKMSPIFFAQLQAFGPSPEQLCVEAE